MFPVSAVGALNRGNLLSSPMSASRIRIRAEQGAGARHAYRLPIGVLRSIEGGALRLGCDIEDILPSP
jgi:hypothetical protein